VRTLFEWVMGLNPNPPNETIETYTSPGYGRSGGSKDKEVSFFYVQRGRRGMEEGGGCLTNTTKNAIIVLERALMKCRDCQMPGMGNARRLNERWRPGGCNMRFDEKIMQPHDTTTIIP